MRNPNTVTYFVRSIPPRILHQLFGEVTPLSVRRYPIKSASGLGQVPGTPLEAGLAFHDLLLRMADSGPLCPRRERPLLPWLAAIRRSIWSAGATEIEIEERVRVGRLVGSCDLVARGPSGGLPMPVEVKTLLHGRATHARLLDLAQLGIYSYALTANSKPKNRRERGGFDEARLAYVELGTGSLTVMDFDLQQLSGAIEPLVKEAA